jgi:hypothetical protein
MGRRERRSCGQRFHRIFMDGLQQRRPKILSKFDLLNQIIETNVIFIKLWVNACLWCDYDFIFDICITLFPFLSMLFLSNLKKWLMLFFASGELIKSR